MNRILWTSPICMRQRLGRRMRSQLLRGLILVLGIGTLGVAGGLGVTAGGLGGSPGLGVAAPAPAEVAVDESSTGSAALSVDAMGPGGPSDDHRAGTEFSGEPNFPPDFPGLVATPPAEGPSVQTAAGYMVPFVLRVPDTDLEFHMVPIPGGKVLLGSPEDEAWRHEIEGPQVEIEVPPFWMGKYEVTWKQYKHFMRLHDVFKRFQDSDIRPLGDDNRLNAVAAPSNLYDPGFTYDAGEGLDEPAATMSQFSAKQFTKWLSLTSGVFFRLPTEAEWEYACRAGSAGAYHFGDDPDDLGDYAWFEDNANFLRHPVGSKKPNAFGLYDMHGNVAEWVLDQAYEEGYEHLAGQEGLTVATAFRWPNQWFGRVAKGGSFELPAEDCRVAARLLSEDRWRDKDPNVPRSPSWYTSQPATGVGMRVMIPFHVPTSREDQEKFWSSDIPEISEAAYRRATVEGRGAFGLVDPELEKAIRESGR